MRLRFLREAKDRGPGSALRSPPSGLCGARRRRRSARG